MKKIIFLLKKLSNSAKAIKMFLKQTIKNYKVMKKKLSKIWLMIFAICFLASCGVTKASVSKPAAGTTTTITITTNNPITTEVSPDVKLNGKDK